MEKTLQESLKNALGVLTIVLLLLSLYIVVQIVTDIKQKRDFDTITVDASAEVFATPDIAEISFSVIKEDKELVNAQEAVDVIVKNTINSLKGLGIEEKDIKTSYYNANPRYEYGKAICLQYRCDDGQRALVGYEANQSISVTIRNLDNVGKVISSLGSADVSNIYGPNFRIEDEETLKAEVREEAIVKAKEKAKALAKNLGVRIAGIENFSEGYGGNMYYAKAEMAMAGDAMNQSAPSFNATLPMGENKVETTVTITYRVK